MPAMKEILKGRLGSVVLAGLIYVFAAIGALASICGTNALLRELSTVQGALVGLIWGLVWSSAAAYLVTGPLTRGRYRQMLRGGHDDAEEEAS